MNDLAELTKKIIHFRNLRDWKQFHNPKDVALSLLLEATEVLEHFQWKSNEEITDYIKTHKKEISLELADVFYWVLLMSNDLGVDISAALEEKMKINEHNYPISKSKGSKEKYTTFNNKK